MLSTFLKYQLLIEAYFCPFILCSCGVQGGSCVGLGPKPQHILYGHNTAVTSVAISAELDIAISGASVSKLSSSLNTIAEVALYYLSSSQTSAICVH